MPDGVVRRVNLLFSKKILAVPLYAAPGKVGLGTDKYTNEAVRMSLRDVWYISNSHSRSGQSNTQQPKGTNDAKGQYYDRAKDYCQWVSYLNL